MKICDFQSLVESGELSATPAVLTIGVFDGAHLGHREIFSRVKRKADENSWTSIVITFDTNPKIRGLKSLDTLRLRASYIESFGIDYMVVIDFSTDFSKITGREFIRLLCTMCRVNAVIVGEDFKCGHAEEQITARELSGVFSSLGQSVSVDIVPPVLDEDHIRISSTRIRELISQGQIARANRLSGSPYRYDLAGHEFTRTEEGYVTQAEGVQRLPESGTYLASLILEDGRSRMCRVRIENSTLTLEDLPYKGTLKADSVCIIS